MERILYILFLILSLVNSFVLLLQT